MRTAPGFPGFGARPFSMFAANTTTVSIEVSVFLCRSDGAAAHDPTSGPTNYAFCTGDGLSGTVGPGDPTQANGTFILGPPQSIASIIDGSSNTAAASEQLLGTAAGAAATVGPTPVPADVRRAFVNDSTGPALNHVCTPSSGWELDKAVGWWEGSMRSTLYNHYMTPDSKLYDCLVLPSPLRPGWTAARSNHLGGVNVLLGDGHVQFIKDTINPVSWTALSTWANGEVISADPH